MSTHPQPTGVFGRLQTYATMTPGQTNPTAELADLPGFCALIRLTSAQGPQTVLSLSQSREAAKASWGRLAASLPAAAEDLFYELDDTVAGPAAGAPTVAFLGRFDGPLSPAQLGAARHRGSEQLRPRLRQVPGLVRLLVLWNPLARSMAVLHLAETRESLHGVTEVVTSTPLGPGDDPTLLPGPDRVGLHRVDHYACGSPTLQDHRDLAGLIVAPVDCRCTKTTWTRRWSSSVSGIDSLVNTCRTWASTVRS